MARLKGWYKMVALNTARSPDFKRGVIRPGQVAVDAAGYEDALQLKRELKKHYGLKTKMVPD